jgi:polysaccharide chain length determinant protein (PEP-CTERM system associated)
VLNALRRRWLLIVLPFVVISGIALVLARTLPDMYYAQGTITIARQQIPDAYVRTTVIVPFAERLRNTITELKSASRLEALINEVDLYADARKNVPMEALTAWMARQITVSMAGADTIVVGYSGYEPAKVAKVADRLLDQFVQLSSEEREMLADSTSRFLDVEVRAARERLEEQERQVRAYREKYAGQLPTQLSTNLQILQGAYAQLQGVVEGVRQDRERIGQLQAALTEARRQPQEPVNWPDIEEPSVEIPADKEPAEAGAPRIPPGPALQRLAFARALRNEMLRKYTAEHPDVQRLDTAIRQLEEAAAALPASSAEAFKALPANEREARVQYVEAEVKRLEDRIKEREALEAQLRKSVAEYQHRVESVPERETEWTELTRDYGIMQQAYLSLLTKSQESRIAANLERRGVGEQLKVNQRPTQPTRPASPNRPGIVLLGIILGVGVGLVMVVGLELLDTSFRSETEVVSVLRLPVLAMVPVVVTQRARRRARRLAWASAAALVTVVAVVVWRWSS